MRNRCVWLFLGLVFLAVRASGESLIEVDENGDEYELKRFYIQGRQLKGDGSQSQCVVTRRKRSSRALSKAGESPASVQVSSQTLNVESLPAGMVEHREGTASLQEAQDAGKRRYVALTGVHYEPHVPNDEGEDDDDEDDDEEGLEDGAVAGQSAKAQAQFVPAALALPLAQGSSQVGAGQQSSAAHLPQGVSVVANAASHANVAEDAGIVVVQSHQPPKVNPDTHAVFELKPIQADAQQPAVSFYPFVHPWEAVQPEDEDDYDEDDYDEEDYDDFYYGGGGVGYFRDQPGYVGLGEYDEEIISEDSPHTTTALWSTDGDDSDIHPVINQPNKRPNQNKNKNKNKNRNKNQNQNQKNRKNKKRISQKKRKEEAEEEEHELMTQKRKKEQKEKDQKKKQDKEQVQMDQSPVDVIKKPAAVASSSLQSSASSSSSMSSASNSSGSNSSDKKKKKKKKKPSSSSSSSTSKRRTKNKKKQGSSSSSLSSGNRRRRPSSHLSSSSSSGFGGSSSSSSSSIGGYRRRRPQQSLQTQQEKRRRQQQRRRKQQNNRRRQQQKRRRNRNKNRQFYGDEPIINCIYINKDPPTTTTPRPFWNILGRQSDAKEAKEAQEASGQDAAAGVEPVDPVAKQAVIQAVRRNFGDFGGRKRTNLRFVS